MPSQELQRHDAMQAKKQQSGSSNGNTQSIPVDAGRAVARAQGEEAGDEGARGERREEVLTGEAINVGQCCLKHPTWTSLARLFFPWSTEGKAGGRKGQVAQLAKVVQGHLDLDQQSTCSRGTKGANERRAEKQYIIYNGKWRLGRDAWWTDGLGRMELAKYKTGKLCRVSTEAVELRLGGGGQPVRGVG